MALDYAEPPDMLAEAPPQKQPDMGIAERLQAIAASSNIVPELGDEVLAELAAKVVAEYDLDETSREDWLKKNEDAMKLAMMVAEEKTYPFDGASNVHYPLLTVGALQFNARAYPAIVQPDKVVKCKTRGRDPDGTKAARAARVSEHMSDQLLNEMPEWEEDTDRLLVRLPIEGCIFRKVYYDPAVGHNCTRLVPAERFVVNMGARSLTDIPRCTEKLYLYPYEVEERSRDGRFIEFDYKNAGKDPEATVTEGAGTKGTYSEEDPDGPMLFLEQHRLYDLDEDGYPEPYICTVHKASAKVVRIVADFDLETVKFRDDGKVASIRRRDYYVKYPFLPNPEGGFYDVGLGWLLKDTNESINTTLNQMFDAGHMANMQGGLISSILGHKERRMEFARGEWKIINTNGMPLNQAVYPIKYDGPSEVLFKLLGLLIESGEKVASIKDVLTGETNATAPVGTTLALIEQGLQVFTSIYKRIHRALKRELAMLARLNGENVTPEAYQAFFDEQVDPKADYNAKDMDILPISDPQAVTKMQKIAKAQAIYELAKENPVMNPVAATARILEAIEAEDIEKLIAQPDPKKQAFNDLMERLQVEGAMNEVLETLTKALKNVADAEAAEEGAQVPWADMYLRTLQAELSGAQAVDAGERGLPGMEGAPGNPMGAGAPEGGGDGMGGGPEGPALPNGQLGPGGMASPASTGGLPQGAM